jgi:mannose-6-phosphate isomerase-like protein (cupin superfamily)
VLELNGKKKQMKPGMSVVIPSKAIHRFCAPYEDVRLIEVSTPHGKDVVRLEDDYKR